MLKRSFGSFCIWQFATAEGDRNLADLARHQTAGVDGAGWVELVKLKVIAV